VERFITYYLTTTAIMGDMTDEPTSTVRIQLKVRYLPYLVGVLFILQVLFPYKGWMFLLVSLGGIWALSYWWARSLAYGLRIVRERRFGWGQVGDRIQEKFTLTNKGRAPGLWVAVIDHSDMPGYLVSRVVGVHGNWQIHWFEWGVCDQRGLYRLGPTSLHTSDPFGFYSVEIDYSASDLMLIMPPVVPLPRIDVTPSGRVGEGRSQSNILEPTVSAGSVREYIPGDSQRWIHWPTTARREALYVRKFDSTLSSDWWIFLDMDQDVQVGEGSASTEEHGVILAASLTSRAMALNRAVGFTACGDELVWAPARMGEDQQWEIFHALALVGLGDCPLDELLERTRNSLRERSSLLIITPSRERRWLDAMSLLMRRGIVPTVFFLDPVSFGGGGNPDSLLDSLVDLGVTHYRITPDLLDRPEARPGEIDLTERKSWREIYQGEKQSLLNWRELA